MKKLKIENALISVFNKDGIAELAEFLQNNKINILASDGTASHLLENKIEVTKISEYIDFPHVLGGRVKTLHPKIYAGVLADPENKEHRKDLEENDILLIQLVVINLYPFEEKMAEIKDVSDLIEFIDIGGVSLIRAGAKNYMNCLVITNPGDYEELIKVYSEEDGIPCDFLEKFSVKAFKYSSFYDSIISRTLEEKFKYSDDEYLSSPYKRVQKLRYGENPHQSAVLHKDNCYRGDSLFNYEQIQGKELSYNNILDIDIAIRVNNDFREPNCVVIKHNNPCGFAVGNADLETFENAWEGDSISAFGSIIGFNYCIEKDIAEVLAKRFVEVIVCRDISDDAREILKKKKRLRVLVKKDKSLRVITGKEIREIKGGLLVQDEDDKVEMMDDLKLVTKTKFDSGVLNDIFYGLKLIRYFKSNSIILIKNNQLIGAGFGQPNRVDCVKMSIEKAGDKITSAVLISDAFFPFRDSIDLTGALELSGIVQPGGSIRDKEVIEACDEFNIPMYITGIRHFRH